MAKRTRTAKAGALQSKCVCGVVVTSKYGAKRHAEVCPGAPSPTALGAALEKAMREARHDR